MSKSILQRKDGTCYLCSLLHYEDGYQRGLEEHHVFEGWANRKKSEHWGLKIYLCNSHHNQTCSESIHKNGEIEDMVKQIAQRAFEERYGHTVFMQEFGKNYLGENEWQELTTEVVTKEEPKHKNGTHDGFKLTGDAEWTLPLFTSADGQLSFAF